MHMNDYFFVGIIPYYLFYKKLRNELQDIRIKFDVRVTWKQIQIGIGDHNRLMKPAKILIGFRTRLWRMNKMMELDCYIGNELQNFENNVKKKYVELKNGTCSTNTDPKIAAAHLMNSVSLWTIKRLRSIVSYGELNNIN